MKIRKNIPLSAKWKISPLWHRKSFKFSGKSTLLATLKTVTDRMIEGVEVHVR